MSGGIDLSRLSSYTNGELLTYCEDNSLPISSNPSREQMVEIIKRKMTLNEQKPAEKTVKTEPKAKTATFSAVEGQKNTTRFPNKKDVRLSTPRLSFSSPSNQPTPILANQNADYERMWEKKLSQVNSRYSQAFPPTNGQISSSIKRISNAERVVSPSLSQRSTTSRKISNANSSNNNVRKFVITFEIIAIIILVFVSLFL